ncbi:hypothetical protein HB364_28715 [Pseudoflavitalea sp. X16]|uniref:hypothetical protein n=1 Tax=Paraflavitalea devenefica TaxID=2716334 RepID=UPI00141FDBC7|nr:hypothetical protein [Paraflavitalea devenefica]NII29096.1 hypothetical protein [Paraflavitalea devenefica]
MTKNFLLSILLLAFGQILQAQTFDTTTYFKLVTADKNEFITYAKSVGLTTDFDTASQALFAKTKGFVYTKPLGDKNNNEYYDLVLIVSTLSKENNKLILKNATENPTKKGTWTDDKYLYIEWDTENPISKEMWHKVLVYKKKK